MRKFLILLGILFFLVAQTQAAETTWRHSGFELWGFDINFTNHNASNVELVNGVNFSDFAKAANHEITIINDTGTAKAFWNGSLLYSGAAQTVMNSSTLLLQNVGGTVKLSCGNFSNIDSVYSYDNVVIEGSGNCTQIRASPNTNPVFIIQGTIPTLIGTVQSNIALGDRIITVDTTAGLTTNDYILLNSSRVTSYLSQPYGEVHKVEYLTPTTIQIDGAYMNYSTGDTAKVYKMNYISDAKFRNFRIQGLGGSLSKIGFNITYGKDIVISGTKIKDIGLSGAILYSSLNTVVADSIFDNASFTGYGYGVSVSDVSQGTKIYNNIFRNQSKHATTIGGSGNSGLSWKTYIYDNIFYGNALRGYCSDEHISGDVYYYNNQYNNCYGGQLVGGQDVIIRNNIYNNMSHTAIEAQAQTGITRNLSVSNSNIISGGDGSGSMGAIGFDVITPLQMKLDNVEIRDFKGIGLYFRNVGAFDFNDPIIISDFKAINISGNSRDGIFISTTSTGVFRDVVVKDAFISQTTGSGIDITANNVTVKNSIVKFAANSNGNPYGIYTTSTNSIINNNDVANYWRFGIALNGGNNHTVCGNNIKNSVSNNADQGIRLVSVSNSTICNNIIKNLSTGGTESEIAEVTAGNNNTIINNIMENGATVTVLGTDTTEIRDNFNVDNNIMRMPICSNTILNQTRSTCWNSTSGAFNIFNGTRWNWAANGTEII